MIVYHKNNEIDRVQWDRCISNTSAVHPYGFSWYLDILSPGWEALVDDDYDAVFPITKFNRFGISYVATPPFFEQLGAYCPDNSSAKAITEFLGFVPEVYRMIDLNIPQNINISGYQTDQKYGLQLDLSDSYQTLFNGFSGKCHRSIETSLRRNSELVDDVTPDEIINLYLRTDVRIIARTRVVDYQKLRNLMNFCLKNKKGRIIGVRGARNKLIFGAFYTDLLGNKTLIFVANSKKGMERHTDYFAMNELIREFSSTKGILDLFGASTYISPSFSESFGAFKVPYFRILKNRIIWPVSLLVS